MANKTSFHFVCNQCQVALFTEKEVIDHQPSNFISNLFSVNSKQIIGSAQTPNNVEKCQFMFIERKEWISDQVGRDLQNGVV